MRSAAVWLVGAGLALAGCGGSGAADEPKVAKPSKLETTHAECVKALDEAFAGMNTGGKTGKDMVLLEDSGRRLAVAQVGDRAQLAASACILRRLGAPQSTLESIDATAPIMGERSDSWGDYEATWSVANPGGISLIVTEK